MRKKKQGGFKMNSSANPCGLQGFAFLEFSGPNKTILEQQFNALGFAVTKKHQQQVIELYQQQQIAFILNATADSQAAQHALIHGPGACAMGFLVEDAKKAFEVAISRGANAFKDQGYKHQLPAIEAIGGSVIYFVDKHHSPFDKHWVSTAPLPESSAAGLVSIDHLTHNVFQGNMDKWADFYQSIFNFHQIRFFDIKGKLTGLVSRALESPCGRIKIPLNESQDERSQIEEFLAEYHGEGIQHIALTTENIYQTISYLRTQGVLFLDVPDTYYELIEKRIPWHKEPVDALKKEKILIDGEKDKDNGLLLQIFTENIFGPVFFEIIQRKGNQGFGEGNFQALFEAMEQDQIRRGTLNEEE